MVKRCLFVTAEPRYHGSTGVSRREGAPLAEGTWLICQLTPGCRRLPPIYPNKKTCSHPPCTLIAICQSTQALDGTLIWTRIWIWTSTELARRNIGPPPSRPSSIVDVPVAPDSSPGRAKSSNTAKRLRYRAIRLNSRFLHLGRSSCHRCRTPSSESRANAGKKGMCGIHTQ